MLEMSTPRLGFVLLFVFAGCSSATSPIRTPAPAPPASVTTNAAAIAKARADSAQYPYTEADVRFMSAMIGHHGQALKMATWASSHGAGEDVQRLADRILNGQLDEIRIMQQWLADRQKTVPGVDDHTHHGHMPGMLTEEQLRELDAARGREFDRLFLTFMIQHHRGATQMVRELFASQGAGQDLTVFKFASDVNVDQTTEINRMQQMLANLISGQRNP